MLLTAFSAPVSTSMKSIGFGLAILGWFTFLIFRNKWKRVDQGPDRLALFVFLLAGAFLLLIDIKETNTFILLWKELFQFAVFYLLLVNHRNILEKAIICLLASSAITVTISIYQSFALGFAQVSGFLDNPNILGGYLVAMIPLTIGAGIKIRRLSLKLILGLLAVGQFWTLFLSGSRSAIAVGLMGMLLYCLFLRTANTLKIIGILFLSAIMFFVFAAPHLHTNLDRFKKDNLIEGASLRFTIWTGALHSIADFPFSGTGLGSFWTAIQRLEALETHPAGIDYAKHAHNILLQVWTEYGYLGVVGALIIFFRLIQYLAQQARRDRGTEAQNPLVLSSLISLLNIAGHSLIDFLFCSSSYTFIVIIIWIYHSTRYPMANSKISPITACCRIIQIYLSVFLLTNILYPCMSISPPWFHIGCLVILSGAGLFSKNEAGNFRGLIERELIPPTLLSGGFLVMITFLSCIMSDNPETIMQATARIFLFIAIALLVLLVYFAAAYSDREGYARKRFSNCTTWFILLFAGLPFYLYTTGEVYYFYKSQQAMGNNDFEQAESYLHKLISCNTRHYNANMLLGRLHSRRGQERKAISAFSSALQSFPSRESLFRFKTESLIQADLWNSVAIKASQFGISNSLKLNDPTNTYIRLHSFGNALLQNGYIHSAIPFLEKARIRNSNDPALILDLGEAYYLSNNYRESLECLDEISTATNPSILNCSEHLRIHILLDEGKTRQAAEHLEKLCLQIPQSPSLRFKLADTFQVLSQHDKAQHEYCMIIKQHPDYLPAALSCFDQGYKLFCHLNKLVPQEKIYRSFGNNTTLFGVTIHPTEGDVNDFYAVTYWRSLNQLYSDSSYYSTKFDNDSALYIIHGNQAWGFHTQNLVPNSTFITRQTKNELPAKWVPEPTHLPANYFRNTKNSYSGKCYLSIKDDNSPRISTAASQFFSVRPDGFYLQGGWIKADDGKAFLGRRWYTCENKAKDYSYVAKAVDPLDWKLFIKAIKSPVYAAKCKIWALKSRGTNWAHFDNLFFFPVHNPWELLKQQSQKKD